MKSTIKDVARLAGASPATVSLVLNHKDGVKQETRDRVMNAVQVLHYRPNQVARSLVNQSSNTIAFIVTDLSNPFFSSLAYNMQRRFDAQQQTLLLGISNNSIRNERKLVQSMASRGVDGVLLVPASGAEDGEEDLKYLYDLKQAGIPLVYVTSKHNGITADCVMTDFNQAMYDLTGHLLDGGSRRIVFFGEHTELLYTKRRIAGYIRAFEERGLKYSPEWIVQEETASAKTGKEATRQKILPMHPDAIISTNATSALGIMACLKENGIDVPEQVKVACFDELEYNDVLYKPLTYASQNLTEICDQAIALMKARLEGSDAPVREILIPSEINVRSSTK